MNKRVDRWLKLVEAGVVTARLLCECNDPLCHLLVDVPVVPYLEYHRRGSFVIADACPAGPDPGAEVVAAGPGWKFYE